MLGRSRCRLESIFIILFLFNCRLFRGWLFPFRSRSIKKVIFISLDVKLVWKLLILFCFWLLFLFLRVMVFFIVNWMENFEVFKVEISRIISICVVLLIFMFYFMLSIWWPRFFQFWNFKRASFLTPLFFFFNFLIFNSKSFPLLFSELIQVMKVDFHLHSFKLFKLFSF